MICYISYVAYELEQRRMPRLDAVHGKDSGMKFCSCKMLLLRCSECSAQNSKKDN